MRKDCPEKSGQPYMIYNFFYNGGEEVIILTINELEKLHIEQILEKLNYNITSVAERIGVSRSTLHRKMKRYGIVVNRSISTG